MNSMLNVSASPHIRSNDSVRSIMEEVIIALIPATLFGVYNFGLKAALIILTCVVTCILTEYVYEKCMKKDITTSDMSAFLTGLLLALNLSPTVPLWIPIIGGVFAILIVKQLFGGIGQNFMNPALAARCFLLISFSGIMTNFSIGKVSGVKNVIYYGLSGINGYAQVDAVSSPTPLALVKSGEEFDLLSAFLGIHAGTIGETSTIAILIGGIYLVSKKIISLRIPAAYIFTFVAYLSIYSTFVGDGFSMDYIVSNLCLGGLMLGAFFMATDYVTSPITNKGKIWFGVILGLLTGVFRTLGGAAEGVSYAIIIGNMLVPLIEKVTMPKPFGVGRR
ncbi:MAG: RnfABCDGE type electron transport complex subunit D [Lachnospiraceae bacterium]|nr:RnfABCDGE type electron transport complex subunit D [Lachnospiraceae bacterium]